MTPNLFVLGAPKCGTTTVHALLASHPDIYAPSEKEPGYYAPEFTSPLSRFDSSQAYAELFRAGGARRYRVDATPWYVYSPGARLRIREDCPDARFVILLRDPAEMVRSLHAECVFQGFETITDLERAVDAPLHARPANARTDMRRMLAYRSLANFGEHVSPWLETMGRDRVHIAWLEDLAADPGAFKAALFEFLDLAAPAAEPARLNGPKHLAHPRVAEWIRDPHSWLRRAGRWMPSPLRRAASSAFWRRRGAPPERPLAPAQARELRERAEKSLIAQGVFSPHARLWRGSPPCNKVAL
jgi:Sulfotransferase family